VPSPGYVTSIAFSRDGRTLVAGSTSATVAEWDIAIPAQPVRLAVLRIAPAVAATSVAFSPDGQVLAAASGDCVLVWNASDPLHTVALGAIVCAGAGQIDAVRFLLPIGVHVSALSLAEVVAHPLELIEVSKDSAQKISCHRDP
jgi:WD40 repeat protein